MRTIFDNLDSHGDCGPRCSVSLPARPVAPPGHQSSVRVRYRYHLFGNCNLSDGPPNLLSATHHRLQSRGRKLYVVSLVHESLSWPTMNCHVNGGHGRPDACRHNMQYRLVHRQHGLCVEL